MLKKLLQKRFWGTLDQIHQGLSHVSTMILSIFERIVDISSITEAWTDKWAQNLQKEKPYVLSTTPF